MTDKKLNGIKVTAAVQRSEDEIETTIGLDPLWFDIDDHEGVWLKLNHPEFDISITLNRNQTNELIALLQDALTKVR